MTDRILNKLDALETAVRDLAIAAAKHAAVLDVLQSKLEGYSRPCAELTNHIENHERWRLRMTAVVIGAILSMGGGIAAGIILASLL
ncbi:MAG: hypothetical protein PHH26_05265 [Candidatus Thermoplasmatota archaeon]|nr:hypothetical protein [Candidatus Thermoplasmatota archaeon]